MQMSDAKLGCQSLSWNPISVNGRDRFPALLFLQMLAARIGMGVFLQLGLALSCGMGIAGEPAGTRPELPAPELPAPEFNRQVRPILAKRCFTCHGPDAEAREADLRLDSFSDATDDLGGHQAIVPGNSSQSEVIRRIRSTDTALRMPPSASSDPLPVEEVEILANWIDAGAKYEVHWAFVPPQRRTVPQFDFAISDDPDRPLLTTAPSAANWSRDPVDRWVASGMAQQQLWPNDEASRLTLVRRLYLDLLGLPPTPSQADQWVHDDSPLAYTRLVDHLLADPEYGQRFARPWLDMARYSDTNGYEKDRPRSIWPYRDWVIRALNDDLPFDQFSIEQLAGDMLPNASLDQRIATGFNRNTMLNEEGGIDPLEFRFLAMVDRVATVGTVWMGLTVGCAQCHTHKYDPITQHDYYALMALLDNADEPEQIVPHDSWLQSTVEHTAELERLQRILQTQVAGFDAWVQSTASAASRWRTPRPAELHSTLPKLRWLSDGSVFADGDATKRDEYRLVYDRAALDAVDPNKAITAIRLEALPDERLPASGPGRSYYEGRRGDFFLSELTILVDGQPIKLKSASHSHGSLSIGSGTTDAANVIDGDGSTGWSTSDRPGRPHQWVAHFASPVVVSQSLEVGMLFERHFAASLGKFRISFTTDSTLPMASPIPAELLESLVNSRGSLENQPSLESSGVGAEELDPTVRNALFPYFLESITPENDLHKEWLARRFAAPAPVTTLVFRERQADNLRPTWIRHRGEYLQIGEQVPGNIPEHFRQIDRPSLGQPDAITDRLQLAKWLASDQNPLVARVAVNRAWQEFFGAGIVRTSGDYGTQSEPPKHPELLDLLALDLQDGGWSMKKLHRRLVHTAVYRQSSAIEDSKRSIDPENRWFSRGPRFRLPAEMIRDALLIASGKLDRTIGGPSVYPQQDPSVTGMAYGSPAWTTSPGGDAFRRSLYTYSKRTAPFAAYQVFDGPTGENCIDRRDRSNTPLQALTLLNDPMYLELAAEITQDVRRELGEQASAETMLEAIFRRLLTRFPTSAERELIARFYEHQQQRVTAGEVNGDKDSPWIWVVRAVMNFDEAITKD